MTEQEEAFLKTNFPAGEYVALTILVRNESLTQFLDHMKVAPMVLAVMPHAKAGLDFANPDSTGTEH